MRAFIMEIKRGAGLRMVIAAGVVFAVMLFSCRSYLPMAYSRQNTSYDVMYDAIYKSGLYAVIIIAAAYTAAGTYIEDERSGYLKYLLSREGITRFVLRRFLAVTLCGAAAVLIGETAFMMLCDSLFPIEDVPYHYTFSRHIMQTLEYENPRAFIFVTLLLHTPLSMAMAALALAVSVCVKNLYVTYISPIIFLCMLSLVPDAGYAGRMASAALFGFDAAAWYFGGDGFGPYMALTALVLCVSLIVFALGVRRYMGAVTK